MIPSLLLPICLFILGVCALAGSPAAAEYPVSELPFQPRLILCPRALSAPQIDGRLDDPAWQRARWSGPFTDIEGPARPEPAFETRVKMVWDQECLYLGARLEEPHLWATLVRRDAVIYHDNDFEIFIDPDGDNHLYYELEINALGTVWDLLLVRPYRDGGPAIDAWDIQGLRTAVALDGTLNDPSDLDRGWTVEVAVPWSVLKQCAGRRAPPAGGDIWRLNFSRVQWDLEARDGRYAKRLDPGTGQPLPEHNWVWSPQGLIAMHYPEMWGEVMFVDDPVSASVESVFAPSTEHRAITAAMKLMAVYHLQRIFADRHGSFASSGAELSGLPESSSLLEGLTGLDWTLDGGKTRFLGRLSTPEGVFTVDETGCLRRDPLMGLPAGAGESSPQR